MNVQQMKQCKITLLAMVLLIVALVCVPRVAFATELQQQGNDATPPANGTPVPVVENADATEEKSDEPVEGEKKDEGEEQVEGEEGVEKKVEEPKPEVTEPETVELDTASLLPETTEKPKAADDKADKDDKDDDDDYLFLAKLKSGNVVKVQQVYKVQRTSTAKVGLSYNTHVQNIGWQGYVGAGATAGTSGRSLRLEGIHLSLTNMGNNSGHIYYQTHVQNIGWQGAVHDGAMSGTQGRSLRLEGIKIWLTGDISNHFDVFYRTHVQNIGWQGWVKNGALAGTTGQSLRLEALQVKLSAKTEEAAGRGANTVGVRYETHVQNIGWQEWTGDGGTAGTTGRSLRVEALNLKVSPGPYSGGITYQAHVQNIGWQGAVSNGATAGTSGRSLRVEALRINLTGDLANRYNVYYRTHVQNYGWMDWASNGKDSGSTGYSLRVEAVQIVLRGKSESAPGSTTYPTVNQMKTTLNGIDIASWQSGLNISGVNADFVIVKATGGTGYTNPYFRTQANATLGSGKLLGLYHFAWERGMTNGNAISEADYFSNAVINGGYVGKAVLFLDWEADALSHGPGWAKQWLDRVHSRTGVRPLIYMSKSVTRSYNWSSVAPQYKLWVAQYPNYNTTGYQTNPWTDGYGYGAWSAPTLFQYTSTGRLSGYGGNLDLDKFYGTISYWRQLAARS